MRGNSIKLTNAKEEVNSQTIRWKGNGLQMAFSMPSLMKKINRRSEEEERKRVPTIRFRETSRTSLQQRVPVTSDSSDEESLSEKVDSGMFRPRLSTFGDITIPERGSLPASVNVSLHEDAQFQRFTLTRKVLLLIGNPINLKRLKADIMKVGFSEFDEGKNEVEGMQMYRTHTLQQRLYAAIFVDLMLPAVNGHSFVRNLRQNERLTHTRRSYVCGVGSELPLDLLDSVGKRYAVPGIPCGIEQLRSVMYQATEINRG